MKNLLKLVLFFICLTSYSQTKFNDALFFNSTQSTLDRNFRVLGLNQNNEVKSMFLNTVLVDTNSVQWQELSLYPTHYAFKARYRIKGDVAEIEIINLVPSVLLPNEKLINAPAVIRPTGNSEGLFFTGYGIYSNTPIMFKLASNGDIFLLSNSVTTQSEPFTATFQYKIFF